MKGISLKNTFFFGLVILAISFVIAMSIGPSNANIFDLFSNNDSINIALKLRLPRVLLGLAVGIALASSGAAYQGLLQNPLADPYLLGVSGGAALGTAIAVGLGLPTFIVPIVAFLVSFFAMVFVFSASARQGIRSLLLTGVVFNAFSFALILFLNAILSQRQAYEMLFFMIGGLDFAPLHAVITCLVLSIVGTIILTTAGRSLNAISFGTEHAKALGVSTGKLRLMVFFASSLMIGAAVATAGMIGFVGLFIPHAIRLTISANNRILIPASGIAGGCFLILMDSFARSSIAYNFLGGELPVGVITALIGAPMFFWLLRNK